MNKKGITIIEVLISISLVSIILLLLAQVMFSLKKINNDESYASNDEISRTEIIKNIESDFLNLKLNGLTIKENEVTFFFKDTTKKLIVNSKNITYGDTTYNIHSPNATYSEAFTYKYTDLDNDYYLITLSLPVLIDNENTTTSDDLVLTYLGLKNDTTSYPAS